MYVLSAENMKLAEEASHSRGISWFDMMENAGKGCAEAILSTGKKGKTVILCGKGKNGGDGLVIARHLFDGGMRDIFVIFACAEMTDEVCLEMMAKLSKYHITVLDAKKDYLTAEHHIKTADIIIDSVFGIGFKGELRGSAKDIIELSNKNKTAYKFAIDLPSGLVADSNEITPCFFETDETLTMISYKILHALKPASIYCGKITVIDIGNPKEDCEAYCEDYSILTHNEALNLLKKKSYNDNKGSNGKVLTITGSKNMVGCVYLCNKAAIESGAGLVTAAFPKGIYTPVVTNLCESVFLPLKENDNGSICQGACKELYEKVINADSIAIGCGITSATDTKAVTEFILQNAKGTVILDADSINAIAITPEILKKAKCNVILTPHPGEMARLTKKSIAEIENSRIATAREFAKEYGVTLHLKGANSITASKDGRVIINTTGNEGMARGGSGDALTGIAATLAAQIKDPFIAMAVAAHIHGLAGDITREEYGAIGTTPTRLVENIYKAMR